MKAFVDISKYVSKINFCMNYAKLYHNLAVGQNTITKNK